MSNLKNNSQSENTHLIRELVTEIELLREEIRALTSTITWLHDALAYRNAATARQPVPESRLFEELLR
jgi:SMC interacting uncharacterized protein involved in chromosome segregation